MRGVDSYDELRMRDGLGSFLSVDVSKTRYDTTLWSNTTFVSPSFVDQSALDHPVRMPLSRILHRATAFEGKRNKTSSRAHPQVEGAGNTENVIRAASAALVAPQRQHGEEPHRQSSKASPLKLLIE